MTIVTLTKLNRTYFIIKTIMTDLGNLINMEQQNISKKSKFRYLNTRSESFEKQLAELLQSLSNYAKRLAKLRDSGDIVVQSMKTLSVTETLNPSFKKSMLSLAKTLETIEGHRDQKVIYLEDKLLPYISKFGEGLQKQREEIRSSSNKLFDGKDRSSSWIKSTNNSSRRRSQSSERTEKGEKKTLQHSIQKYELKRNLILKKFMLKLILSEMRFTISTLNNLTHVYKHISLSFSPMDDLKIFNEFLGFRSLSKSAMVEIEENVNSVESTEEADSDERSSEESGLEENDDSDNRSERDSEFSFDEDTKRTINSEEDSENSKDFVSIQSTLRRFNSTPEIPKSKNEKIENNQIEMIKGKNKNKMGSKKMDLSKNKTEFKRKSTKQYDSDDPSDEDDDTFVKIN